MLIYLRLGLLLLWAEFMSDVSPRTLGVWTELAVALVGKIYSNDVANFVIASLHVLVSLGYTF